MHFNFIQAHSECLFGKGEATRKDVEQNAEAGKWIGQLAESPKGAKSKKIAELKGRCAGLADQPEADASTRAASHEDLQAVTLPKFDWAALAAEVAALKEKRSESSNPSSTALEEAPVAVATAKLPLDRPVPTPARSDNCRLPGFVLKSLEESASKPIAPFPTVGGEDDAEMVEPEEPKATRAAKKSGKKKAQKAPKKKAKKRELVGPEEEKALELCEALPQYGGTEKGVLQEAEQKPTYAANSFNAQRLEFIKARRQEGSTYKEACSAWMMSNNRSSLLMSMAELKRRRFA